MLKSQVKSPADVKESSQVTADVKESSQVTADVKESSQVTADVKEVKSGHRWCLKSQVKSQADAKKVKSRLTVDHHKSKQTTVDSSQGKSS